MSTSAKDKLFYLFRSFTEDYRKRRTRLDARVLFRMEINNLALYLTDDAIYRINELQQQFVDDYLSLKNTFRKKNIRIKAIQLFESTFQDQSYFINKKKPGQKAARVVKMKVNKEKRDNPDRGINH